MITCVILKIVAASAAEEELGALFVNTEEVIVIRLTISESGHPQLSKPIYTNNTTAIDILNSTTKRQRQRSMEMRYFWLLDQALQKYFKSYCLTRVELLADCPKKANIRTIHTHVSPYYLHMHTR